MISKVKDPQEDLDYTWDFADLLATGETITSYEFTPTLPVHDDANSTTAVTAFVGPGGTAGTDYEVSCTIVTNATPPRTFERSIKFRVRSL